MVVNRFPLQNGYIFWFRTKKNTSFAAGHHTSVSSNLIVLLSLLPLCLALFAFILPWRGELDDPVSQWSSDDSRKFIGMDTSRFGTLLHSSSRSSDCNALLGNSNVATFAHFRDWKSKFESDLKPKICITSSTSTGLDQILQWIFYHKVIGVSSFFLFVEGKSALPTVSSLLESIPGVKVIYRTKELEKQQASSWIWNETWLSSFFYKPCNFELFVKQSLNIEMALVMARDAGVDWIIHLDTDELIHPAVAQEYSLRKLLLYVPGDVDMVIFPNYESSIERDDIKEPFTEVSMFKKHYDHLTKDTYLGMYKESNRGNPNYFLTYGNGKSAARVQDHLCPNGAHRWHNYMKTSNGIKLYEAAVLHYTYAKFRDLTSRRDRASCKPTKVGVKRCFMLEFDREAFIVTSTASKILNWYHEHVVWTDPSPILKLLRKGILTCTYALTIIHGLQESGMFESIVEYAQESFSKWSNNSSNTAEPIQTFPRKMGSNIGPRATERKALEAATTVPPLSPPAMDLDPGA